MHLSDYEANKYKPTVDTTSLKDIALIYETRNLSPKGTSCLSLPVSMTVYKPNILPNQPKLCNKVYFEATSN